MGPLGHIDAPCWRSAEANPRPGQSKAKVLPCLQVHSAGRYVGLHPDKREAATGMSPDKSGNHF